MWKVRALIVVLLALSVSAELQTKEITKEEAPADGRVHVFWILRGAGLDEPKIAAPERAALGRKAGGKTKVQPGDGLKMRAEDRPEVDSSHSKTRAFLPGVVNPLEVAANAQATAAQDKSTSTKVATVSDGEASDNIAASSITLARPIMLGHAARAHGGMMKRGEHDEHEEHRHRHWKRVHEDREDDDEDEDEDEDKEDEHERREKRHRRHHHLRHGGEHHRHRNGTVGHIPHWIHHLFHGPRRVWHWIHRHIFHGPHPHWHREGHWPHHMNRSAAHGSEEEGMAAARDWISGEGEMREMRRPMHRPPPPHHHLIIVVLVAAVVIAVVIHAIRRHRRRFAEHQAQFLVDHAGEDGQGVVYAASHAHHGYQELPGKEDKL